MRSSVHQVMEQDQGQLNELVSTNKLLANQKRELHRQKLRVFSEKAVKLRCILRQTTDHEERRCIESKIKGLQEKQDAEITKLSKIDLIQKQIDEFITEENEDPSQELMISNKQSIKRGIEDTPAQRLRTKSSVAYRTHGKEKQNQPLFAFSRKNSFSKKSFTDELLLKDSRQALEEINTRHLTQNISQSQQLSKQFSRQRRKSQKYTYYKNDHEIISSSKKDQRVKFDYESDQKRGNMIDLDGIPFEFVGLIQKVHQFWPQDFDKLAGYFKDSQQLRTKAYKIQSQSAILAKKQEKLREEENRLRKMEQRTKKSDNNLKHLIEKQRDLMERIDKQQRQERLIYRKIESSLSAIADSLKIVSKNEKHLQKHIDPIKENVFGSDSTYKLSNDSFESFSDNGVLQQQLKNFEKRVQQYLLGVERQIMLVSGELQKINIKMGKSKDELSKVETKKRQSDFETQQTELALAAKKGQLKQLESTMEKLKEQVTESSATMDIKKSLGQELQQKCERLKSKKKSLSDRVKRLQEDIQSLIKRKQELFEVVIELQQKSVAMKTYQKQLQTKIIFFERDKNNRQKDIQLLELKAEEILTRIQQSKNTNEQIALKVSEQQVELLRIKENIKHKNQDEIALEDRLKKLQLKLDELTTLLESQTAAIQEQSEQVAIRQAENIEIQSKIAKSNETLQELQAQLLKLEQKLLDRRMQMESEGHNLEQMMTAKNELQDLIHQVIVNKEELLEQVEEKSKDLQLLLDDLDNGQEDYSNLSVSLKELNNSIIEKTKILKKLHSQSEQMRKEMDFDLEEEENLVGRLSKLKEMERTILLGIGVKGGFEFLDEELKGRVAQAVGEVSAVNELKNLLKECKYQNRKLKLQNQRLNKLIEN